MADIAKVIRVAARAAILRNGHILLIACDEAGYGPHYNIPGGGVDYHEPVREAVRREVREETCLDVTVGRLLLTVEALHEDALTADEQHHGIALVFECRAAPDAEPRLPAQPDSHQVGVRWVPVDDLTTIPLLPEIGRELRAVLRGEPDAPAFARHTRVPR
jgi:ADP-ribose pyrophosphatase YjhB (NUDIX family)